MNASNSDRMAGAFSSHRHQIFLLLFLNTATAAGKNILYSPPVLTAEICSGAVQAISI